MLSRDFLLMLLGLSLSLLSTKERFLQIVERFSTPTTTIISLFSFDNGYSFYTALSRDLYSCYWDCLSFYSIAMGIFHLFQPKDFLLMAHDLSTRHDWESS